MEIAKIENAMTVLKEKEREFVKLKYIEGHSWEVVAYKIDRAKGSCINIDREAICKIEQILNVKI